MRRRIKRVLPSGVFFFFSFSALSAGKPTTMSYKTKDIRQQPRRTSGFHMMKCLKAARFYCTKNIYILRKLEEHPFHL